MGDGCPTAQHPGDGSRRSGLTSPVAQRHDSHEEFRTRITRSKGLSLRTVTSSLLPHSAPIKEVTCVSSLVSPRGSSFPPIARRPGDKGKEMMGGVTPLFRSWSHAGCLLSPEFMAGVVFAHGWGQSD